MARFPWGRVIDRLTFNFDGAIFKVTKFHPRIADGVTVTNKVDMTKVEYHCEELHESSDNLYALLLSWLAYKHFGLNSGALVSGICRALCIRGEK